MLDCTLALFIKQPLPETLCSKGIEELAVKKLNTRLYRDESLFAENYPYSSR
jgi:hypothetical protein